MDTKHSPGLARSRQLVLIALLSAVAASQSDPYYDLGEPLSPEDINTIRACLDRAKAMLDACYDPAVWWYLRTISRLPPLRKRELEGDGFETLADERPGPPAPGTKPDKVYTKAGGNIVQVDPDTIRSTPTGPSQSTMAIVASHLAGEVAHQNSRTRTDAGDQPVGDPPGTPNPQDAMDNAFAIGRSEARAGQIARYILSWYLECDEASINPMPQEDRDRILKQIKFLGDHIKFHKPPF